MAEINNTSDDDLLRRSGTGDEQAFIALYRRRQAGVYRFALHMCGNAALAEEAAQEVFLTVIRDGGRFDSERGSAGAYLHGIARNQVLRLLERDRAYVGLDDDSGPETVADTGDCILSSLTRMEAIEAVRQAVLTLPVTYRETVVLCDLEEMSYADAAAMLGVPVGTVRSRLNRGRAILLERLKSAGRPAAGGFSAMRCFA